MKKYLNSLLVVGLSLNLSCLAVPPTPKAQSISLDPTTGLVVSPTNFWQANGPTILATGSNVFVTALGGTNTALLASQNSLSNNLVTALGGTNTSLLSSQATLSNAVVAALGGTNTALIASTVSAVGGSASNLTVRGTHTTDNFTVRTNATINGTLGVVKDVAILGGVIASGPLLTTTGIGNLGDITNAGAIYQAGTAYLNAASVSNNATIGGTLNVTGGSTNAANAGVAGTLYAGGAVTFGSTATFNYAGSNPFLLGDGTWGGSTFPVVFFQRSANGGMAFDLMPKGSGLGPAWMDICDTDITLDSTNWSCLNIGRQNTDTAHTYWHIGSNRGGTGSLKPLIIQKNMVRTSSGTFVGIGGYGTNDFPLVPLAVRFNTDENFGFDSINSSESASTQTIRMQAYNNLVTAGLPVEFQQRGKPLYVQETNDINIHQTAVLSGSTAVAGIKAYKNDQSTLIPLSIWTTSLRVNFDGAAGHTQGFVFEGRPATDSMMVLDNSSGPRWTALNDSWTPIVLHLNGSSVQSDAGFSVGGSLTANTAFSVISTTQGTLPAPVMTNTQKKSAAKSNGALIFNSSYGTHQLTDGTSWYDVSGRRSIKTVTTTYAMASDGTDDYGTVFCDTTGGAFVVTVPAASAYAGRVITIMDGVGNAATANITIKSAGGNINGTAASTGVVVNSNYGGKVLQSNATQWLIIGTF